MEQVQPPPQAKKGRDSRQLIITLSVPDGEVIKVETLDKSGKKQNLQDEDFATLAGDQVAEDLLPVLEQAYMAGFSDANGDIFESGDEEEIPDDDDLEQVVVRGVASRTLIRRGVRKLILGRLVKRELLRKQGSRQSPPASTSEMSH